MPIRDGEKFCEYFLADTAEEAEELMVVFEKDISMLAGKFASFARNIDRFDLRQEGLIGLARAKRDFEEDRSENFRIFALYKIKDAMREFVTTQGLNIRVPQYIANAVRLAQLLKKAIEKVEGQDLLPLVDMWKTSEKYVLDEYDEGINQSSVENILHLREGLNNLAERSHVTVPHLLERAELAPIVPIEIVDYNIDRLTSSDNLLSAVYHSETIEAIKLILNERDFNIVQLHFIEGHTIRDIADKLGVADGSIAVQIRKIREKLERYRHLLLDPQQSYTVSTDELPLQDNSLEDRVANAQLLEQLKGHVSQKDFDLLYRHYADGETLRGLSSDFGVSAPALAVRIKRLKKVLSAKYGDMINESDTDTEETESGYGS